MQKQKSTRLIPAEQLVTADRFDLMAKYLYAKRRERHLKTDYPLQLYHEHLRVWNGFSEFDNPDKQSFEAYLFDFHNILDSIGRGGMDPAKSTVSVDAEGNLLNGAHRVAACLLHRKPVVATTGEDGVDGQKVCDFRMFRQMGLDANILDQMALEYATLKKNCVVATAFPAAFEHYETMEKILESHGCIVYEKTVDLRNNGPLNYIKLLYDSEEWLGDVSTDFPGAREKRDLCFTKVRPIKVFLMEFESDEASRRAKEEVRKFCGIKHNSIHINDTQEETLRIARAVLNENSIHFLNYSPVQPCDFLRELRHSMEDLISTSENNIEDYCVTASSTISAYGLREPKDLDYLHSYNSLPLVGHELIHSHNSYGINRYPKPYDDIIHNPANHFYVGNLKFASLDIVRELKRLRDEPKDRMDVRFIDSLPGRSTTPEPSKPSFVKRLARLFAR